MGLFRSPRPEGLQYWRARPGEKLTRADKKASRVSWLEAPYQKPRLQRQWAAQEAARQQQRDDSSDG